MSRRTLTAMFAALLAVPLSSRALPFEPGEEFKMNVSFLSVGIGDFQCSVRDDVDAGVRVWPIRMHGTTHGIVGALYKINSSFTTNFNPATKSSTSSVLDEHTGAYHKNETVKFVGNSAVIHRVANNYLKDETTQVPPGSMDILAAIYAIRAQPLNDQTEMRFPIFTGHKSWDLTARVVGHESITTEAGKFDAIVLRCQTQFGGKFAAKGEMTVWVSNDDRRIPLRIQAPFSIGTVEASLVSYHAGALAQN